MRVSGFIIPNEPENPDTPGRDEEPTLDVRQMVVIFLNSVIFIKIPLLIFGFRMSEEATPFNIGGFALCLAISIFTMVRFVLKNK